MIDLKKTNEKFKSLNDRINKIQDSFGEETVQELMARVEVSLKSFLIDFKELSSKSFNIYWEKQESLKFEDNDKIDNEIDNKSIPKFISDYNRDNSKK